MDKKTWKGVVLQVIPHTTYSGVEVSATRIAYEIQNLGYQIIALSESKELEMQFLKLGIKHYYINIHSSNPFVILKNALKISKIIKSEKIDIVHARSRAPAWSCALAAKLTKVFFITTFHGIYDNSGIFKRYYNNIMTKGKKIIAISEFVKDYIMRNYNVREDKIVLIRRGVDSEYFYQEKVSDEIEEKFRQKYQVTNSIIILVPSDFSRRKGHLLILKALDKIRDLKFSCLFVGNLAKNREYTEEVRNKIISLKLQSKVKIFCSEPDEKSLYSISDIVVSPNIEPKAFDIKIIKAQLMKKISIASKLGSSTEIISDKVTGFLFNTSDYIDLADKLRFVIENINSSELNTMRDDSRKSAIENFSLERMVKETAELYDRIMVECKKK
jgi:glycosyltransferase involved in cell wall biosynthesis